MNLKCYKFQRSLTFLAEKQLIASFTDKMATFDPRLLKLNISHKNSCLLDYFQCDQYHSDIRDNLLKEFVVTTPLNAKTIKIATQISSTENPVAVHADNSVRPEPQMSSDSGGKYPEIFLVL